MKAFTIAAYKFGSILMLATAIATSSLAINVPKAEKKKTLEKTIKLSANQKVEIENSFGTVTIINQPGNEMKILVTATANAASDERAQAILDKISLDLKIGSSIQYETDIKGSVNNNGKNGKQNMEINVEVRMPSSHPLEVENSFGATFIPDRSGLTSLEQKFGDLKTGKLTQIGEITVEFGSMNAAALTGGKTAFKYSNISIGSLHGTVLSSYEFCKSGKLVFAKDLTEVLIKNSYSDLNIEIPSGFDGSFDIQTSFGDLSNNSGINIQEEKDDDDFGPKFDKTFSGKSGSGKCMVRIKSSFGKIKLN